MCRWYITGIKKMNSKKFVLSVILAISLPFCCKAQNIIQISNDGNRNNNNYNQQQECPFRINGICSSEDIGGVAFEKKNVGAPNYLRYDYVATNYNSFPVTVLILETYWCNRYTGSEENVLTIVLQPNESKAIGSHAWCNEHHIQSITRRLGGK